MSLLLSAGHVNAQHYPIGRVHDEAGLVEQRRAAELATQNLLLQKAISSILSKNARKSFTKDVGSLIITSKPKPGIFDQGKRRDEPQRR